MKERSMYLIEPNAMENARAIAFTIQTVNQLTILCRAGIQSSRRWGEDLARVVYPGTMAEMPRGRFVERILKRPILVYVVEGDDAVVRLDTAIESLRDTFETTGIHCPASAADAEKWFEFFTPP